MSSSTITTEIGQPLDVHGNFTPAVTLDDILFLKHFPDAVDIVTVEIVAVHCIRKIYFIKNLASRG